jgi:hypothetical protein
VERYQRSLRFPICSWYLHHRHLSGGLLRFRSNTSESAATPASLLPLSSPTTRGNTNQATRTRTRQLEPDTESGNWNQTQNQATAPCFNIELLQWRYGHVTRLIQITMTAPSR